LRADVVGFGEWLIIWSTQIMPNCARNRDPSPRSDARLRTGPTAIPESRRRRSRRRRARWSPPSRPGSGSPTFARSTPDGEHRAGRRPADHTAKRPPHPTRQGLRTSPPAFRDLQHRAIDLQRPYRPFFIGLLGMPSGVRGIATALGTDRRAALRFRCLGPPVNPPVSTSAARPGWGLSSPLRKPETSASGPPGDRWRGSCGTSAGCGGPPRSRRSPTA
jgi:hypothetical protein